MRALQAVACSLAFAAALPVLAAAPPLHVTETVTIHASPDAVWGAIKDFNGLNNWHPAVATDEIVDGQNDTVGAIRLLTLKDGGTIKEKLLAYDPAKRVMRYSILEGVVPVSHYSSTLTVADAGKGKTLVTWSGRFRRKNTGDNPGDNENDQTAVTTIKSIYRGGLDNLKKQLEAAH